MLTPPHPITKIKLVIQILWQFTSPYHSISNVITNNNPYPSFLKTKICKSYMKHMNNPPTTSLTHHYTQWVLSTLPQRNLTGRKTCQINLEIMVRFLPVEILVLLTLLWETQAQDNNQIITHIMMHCKIMLLVNSNSYLLLPRIFHNICQYFLVHSSRLTTPLAHCGIIPIALCKFQHHSTS